ncbi:hypothetical protein LPB136_08720 [Tenacibaculum todarodis]|uniref:Uncharacterized protein n=1 Tax=Tenacibaculum todarodis TaxID=1850252 RepID=A0A1L3JK13_9FLAO|nr:hypothetical protein [Tenacibaculum todarodis]APG65432.1 hypothetical protein LPB136_08720 [Tenacibaculum todarodis]
MYDTLKIKHQVIQLPKEVIEQQESPFFWKGLKWTPIFNKKTNQVKGYETSVNNLDLRLKGNIISCNNSLQKWYMGNNYQLFTYVQVVEALKKLNSVLPFNVYNANIHYLAVGTVIEEEAQAILNPWLSLNGKTPIPMLGANKQYGKKFYLTDYNVKGYDKTFEVKTHNRINIGKPIFRFELEIYTRNLNKRKNAIGIYTVKDLIDKKKYKMLADELLCKYDKIEKEQSIPLSELNTKEKEVLALFQNQEILKQYKIDHSETYRKRRKVYNNLKKSSNNKYLTHVKEQLKTSVKHTLF